MPPITAITQQLLRGMQGSCSSGAFNGIPREPSASMRITSHSDRCASASMASGENPCAFPVSLSNDENKIKWGMWETHEEVLQITAKTTGQWETGINICVVVVINTRLPLARSTSASQKSRLVFPLRQQLKSQQDVSARLSQWITLMGQLYFSQIFIVLSGIN